MMLRRALFLIALLTGAPCWAVEATPYAPTTSAGMLTRITDETGSGGALVFATSPTLSAPIIGQIELLDATQRLFITDGGSTYFDLDTSEGVLLIDNVSLQLENPLGVAFGGTGAATTAAARASLGVAIGTDVQDQSFTVVNTTANGATDNTDDIQDAIDAVSAAGGGTVFLPAGHYRLSPSDYVSVSAVPDTIPKGCLWVRSDVTIVGAGVGATILEPLDSCTKDCPVFMLPKAEVAREIDEATHHVRIANLEIDGNKQRCADPATTPSDWGEGEGINCKEGVHHCWFDSLYIHDTIQDAIDLDGSDDTNIVNLQAKDCGGAGIHCQGIDGTFTGNRNTFANIVVVDCGQEGHTAGLQDRAGVTMGANDTTLSNFAIVDCVRGITLAPGNTTGRREVTGGSINSCDNEGVWVKSSNADNILSAVHVRDSGAENFLLEGNRCKISNCSGRGATGKNFHIKGCRDVVLTGCEMYEGASETDSIYVDLTGITGNAGIVITGCNITSQSEAVEITNASGISGGFLFHGNNLTDGGTVKLGNIVHPMICDNRGMGSTQFNTSTDVVWENNSGLANIRTVTATTTATTGDGTLLGDATSAAFDVDLPAAASHDGRLYYIKKIDSSVNAVSIDPNGSELIDGSSTSYVLAAQWDSVIVQSNGTSWFILGIGP
jgi:hypothetical protein